MTVCPCAGMHPHLSKGHQRQQQQRARGASPKNGACSVIRSWRPRSATLERHGGETNEGFNTLLQVERRETTSSYYIFVPASSREEGMDPSIHLSLNSVSKIPRLESLCCPLICSHALDRHARANVYSITSPIVGREGPVLPLVVASRHIHRGKGSWLLCEHTTSFLPSPRKQTEILPTLLFAYHLPLFSLFSFCQHVPCRISISVVEGT